MEELQDSLAAIPYKYEADFMVLLPDPLIHTTAGSSMLNGDRHAHSRRKKERTPFATIASFFSVLKGTIQ
jgi:hypothetical protein